MMAMELQIGVALKAGNIQRARELALNMRENLELPADANRRLQLIEVQSENKNEDGAAATIHQRVGLRACSLTLAACSQVKKSCPVSALPLSTVRLISGLKLIMPQMPKVPVLAALVNNTTPGYGDGHASGHLAVDLPLELAFSLKVGVKAERAASWPSLCR